MQHFLMMTLRWLKRLLGGLVLVVVVLSFLGSLSLALFALARAVGSVLPILQATPQTWTLTGFALAFTGFKVFSYAVVAETFPQDKTCKAFKRGRSRSSTRNAFLWTLVGNQVAHLPLGPLLVYLGGLLVMYLAAVASEPIPFWRTVALDWAVKHWLNQADVLLVLAVIQGSWSLAGATVLVYSAWLLVILTLNVRRSQMTVQAALQRAATRLMCHDKLFRAMRKLLLALLR
jgi:hypothetical protein